MNPSNCIILYVSTMVLPDNKAEFEKKLIHIVDLARQSKGCLKYQWFINPDDSNNYVIYGEFDSDDHFALYRKSEVVQMIGKQLLPLLKNKPGFKHVRAEVFEQA